MFTVQYLIQLLKNTKKMYIRMDNRIITFLKHPHPHHPCIRNDLKMSSFLKHQQTHTHPLSYVGRPPVQGGGGGGGCAYPCLPSPSHLCSSAGTRGSYSACVVALRGTLALALFILWRNMKLQTTFSRGKLIRTVRKKLTCSNKNEA